jgi:hypothetical protein
MSLAQVRQQQLAHLERLRRAASVVLTGRVAATEERVVSADPAAPNGPRITPTVLYLEPGAPLSVPVVAGTALILDRVRATAVGERYDVPSVGDLIVAFARQQSNGELRVLFDDYAILRLNADGSAATPHGVIEASVIAGVAAPEKEPAP